MIRARVTLTSNCRVRLVTVQSHAPYHTWSTHRWRGLWAVVSRSGRLRRGGTSASVGIRQAVLGRPHGVDGGRMAFVRAGAFISDFPEDA
jgi:hypothetical protein